MTEQKTKVTILREALLEISKTSGYYTHAVVHEALAEAEKASRSFTIEEVEKIAREFFELDANICGWENAFTRKWQQKKKELLGGKDE